MFTGNTANDDGGAMYIFVEMSPLLTNCTFSGNSAVDRGGAIYSRPDAETTLAGCILWENSATQGRQIFGPAGVRYSCIQGGWGGTGNINANPLFADPLVGDYRLSADSPSINAGDPDYVPAEGETELDGHARVLCDRVDMGAYEFGIGDFDCDRIVDLFDFAEWEACGTGPDGGPYVEGCEAFDFDGDLDVDFAGFQVVFSGP